MNGKLLLIALCVVAALGCSDDSGDGSFKDPRDGQVYKTVKIGDQVWMAQNLNYGKPLESKSELSLGEKWCYGDSLANCEKYGGLYIWKVAKESCPEGWHLPTAEEWMALEKFVRQSLPKQECKEKYLDGSCKIWEEDHEAEATALASKDGWENYVGENSFGFNALPGGIHVDWDGGKFAYLGGYTVWWSATEEWVPDDPQIQKWARMIGPQAETFGIDLLQGNIGWADCCSPENVQYGASVRCVKD